MQPPMTKTCNRCGQEATEDALFCPRCGNSLKTPGADPLLGQVIADRYLLLEKIGEGRSGVIYRGEHTALRKKVAVKILHQQLSSDDNAMERFRREATTVGEIDNDHILQVLDFGRAGDGRLFFAMELLDGEPLSKLLEREGKLPVPRAIDILTQAGEALMEAHALGYVHRDLRPRNIFLTKKRGKSDFVKLLDFGLSKLIISETDPGSTVMGITFGDPRYISPEQARGDTVDRRSDLYSLGAVMFEMLTGEAPFGGERASDIIEQHLKAQPPSPRSRRAEVPEWLDKVVARALAKSPDDRFITVLRMIECLKEQRAPVDEKVVDEAHAATEPFKKAPAPEIAPPVAAVAAQPAVKVEASKTIVPGDVPPPPAAPAVEKRPEAEAKKDSEPETARLPHKVVVAAAEVAKSTKANGTGPQNAVTKPVLGDQSRKSKKQQKQEKRAEEQRKRDESKKSVDNWWPPERKAPDEAATTATRPMPAVVVEPAPASAPTVEAPAAATAPTLVEAKAPAVAPVSAKVEVEPAIAPEEKPAAKTGSQSGSQRKIGGESGAQRKIGSESGAFKRIDTDKAKKVGAQTGEHDQWFDAHDESQPSLPVDDEFDEGPRKRNVGLIAGLAVGGVVVVGLGVLALVGRGGGDKPVDAPKRSYDTPAVSAALEGKKDEKKPEAPPAPKVEEPPKPEAVAAPKVEPKPEPKVEPAPAPEPPKPEVAVAPKPEPKAEPKPEPKPAVVEKKAPERDDSLAKAAPKPPVPKGSPKVPEGFRDPFSDKQVAAAQVDAFVKYGRQKLNSGDVAGAAAQFNKAREYDNKNADAIAGLGECAFEQGDYNGATVFLRQATKLAPHRTHNVVLLGQAYYKLGKTKEAVAEYKRALKLDPRNEEAAHSLEVAERKLNGG